ncbi:hypothetical protein HanIR_Chr09g0439451 [Helianthus annuus]|nr:hypothetical protein HanIR_Chr09g0439451 [Helianthus annuus]
MDHPVFPPCNKIHRNINEPIILPQIQRFSRTVRSHVSRRTPIVEHPEFTCMFHLS